MSDEGGLEIPSYIRCWNALLTKVVMKYHHIFVAGMLYFRATTKICIEHYHAEKRELNIKR